VIAFYGLLSLGTSAFTALVALLCWLRLKAFHGMLYTLLALCSVASIQPEWLSLLAGGHLIVRDTLFETATMGGYLANFSCFYLSTHSGPS